jgi:hypothetical protein
MLNPQLEQKIGHCFIPRACPIYFIFIFIFLFDKKNILPLIAV